MPHVVELHEEARLEVEEAFSWYLSRSILAAEGFLRELERGLALVAESPTLWTRYQEDSRRYLLRRYPFALIYQLRNERVIVLAVAHLKRRPGYWKARGGA